MAHPKFHPRSPVMGSKERSWFERQSHTLGVQEALLWSELRGSRRVTPKKVFLIGQYSDGFTGGPPILDQIWPGWKTKAGETRFPSR